MPDSSSEISFDERIFEPNEGEIIRVVYTRPNQENRLLGVCRSHDIVCYLPLRKVWKPMTQRHGGKVYQYPKTVLRPMFPNYVFVKMHPEERTILFNSNTIIRILHDTDENKGKLLDEIRLVHQIETIALSEEVEFNAKIKEGDKFLIESGPWQGIYGWLKKKRKRCLWTVEIECVNSFVQATIDPSLYKMTPVE